MSVIMSDVLFEEALHIMAYSYAIGLGSLTFSKTQITEYTWGMWPIRTQFRIHFTAIWHESQGLEIDRLNNIWIQFMTQYIEQGTLSLHTWMLEQHRDGATVTLGVLAPCSPSTGRPSFCCGVGEGENSVGSDLCRCFVPLNSSHWQG